MQNAHREAHAKGNLLAKLLFQVDITCNMHIRLPLALCCPLSAENARPQTAALTLLSSCSRPNQAPAALGLCPNFHFPSSLLKRVREAFGVALFAGILNEVCVDDRVGGVRKGSIAASATAAAGDTKLLAHCKTRARQPRQPAPSGGYHVITGTAEVEQLSTAHHSAA